MSDDPWRGVARPFSNDWDTRTTAEKLADLLYEEWRRQHPRSLKEYGRTITFDADFNVVTTSGYEETPMEEAMTDQEMIATLFVSDEGEIKSLPEFAGKEAVTYQYPKRPVRFPIDPAEAMKPVEYTRQIWRCVWILPEFAQKAICHLYRERAEAQDLALGWFREETQGVPGVPSPAKGELWRKTRELERTLDEEKRRR